MVLYKRKITKKKYKGGATSAEIRDFINKRAASTIQKRTKKRLNMQKDKGILFSNEMRKGVSVYSRSLPTINLEGSVIDNITLSNKSLDGINLKGSKIDNSKMVKTKLRGANLTNAIINNCTLRDSNFTGAILHKAHFTNIGTCENINFSDANLSQSKFKNVYFCSPNFHNSNLENLPRLLLLSKADLNQDDLAKQALPSDIKTIYISSITHFQNLKAGC